MKGTINKTKIENLIKQHLGIIRQNKTHVYSIYDFPIYNNIFIEDILLFTQQLMQNDIILDFGCGRETSTYILANLGYQTTGIDINYQKLSPTLTSYVLPEKKQTKLWSTTQKNCPRNKINFTFYKGKKLPFSNNTFDAIFAYAVLEHVKDINFTLKELHRVLKPHGLLFISRTPNKFSLLENLAPILKLKAHKNKYTSSEIKTLLKKNNFTVNSQELIDFFPSNIPIKPINKLYQKFHQPIMILERWLRFTPIKLLAHHYRIFAINN